MISLTFCKISVKLFDIMQKDKVLGISKEMLKNETQSSFYNCKEFILIVHLLLTVDHSLDFINKLNESPEILNLNNLNLISLESTFLELNVGKSIIVDLLGKLLNLAIENGNLDNNSTFKNYVKSVILRLIQNLGQAHQGQGHSQIPKETASNTKQEIVLIKYVVRMIDLFIIAVPSSIGVEVFADNYIE